MKLTRIAVLTAAACLSLPAVLAAQTEGTNVQSRNGLYFNAATNQMTDINGNVYVVDADRDRDRGSLTNAGFSGASLASGQAKQATGAIAVSEFGKFDLMLSWNTAAAADSDSVAIAVRIYGKVSSSPGDGLNYLVTPSCGCPLDTATVVLPTGVSTTPREAPPTFLVLSPMKVAGTASQFSLKVDGTQRVVTVPANRIRLSSGTNAVLLNLGDLVGDFSAPYLLAELANWGATNLTNVTLSLWPRVQ